MEKLYIGLGNQFKEKPDKFGIIDAKQKAINNYRHFKINEIAEMVGNKGYSLIPSFMKGGLSQSNFVSMKLFLLDFDGAKRDVKQSKYIGTNISFAEVKKRAEDYGLKIAFAYKTLSCPDTEEFYKFRIAFVNDQMITDINVANLIYKSLLKIFPECDSACTEVSRMFLGGKELIYIDPNARINLMQLISSLYQIFEKDGHYQRNLYGFIKKNHLPIAIKNNLIAVGTGDMFSCFGEKADSLNLVILKAEPDYLPIFYVRDSLKKGSVHQEHTCKKKSNLDINSHRGICNLLDSYISNEDELDHMERFILATNLNQFSGGLSLFYEILKENYSAETYDKWCRDKSTLKRYGPCACNESCRFFKECKSYSSYPNIVTKLLNDHSVRVGNELVYGTIEEAEQQLKINLEDAVTSIDRASIHLIRAQTALGKTTSIKEFIRNHPGMKILIAEPLNRLKMDLYNELKAEFDCVGYTPSARDCIFIPKEIREEYELYHQSGRHKEARRVIQDCLKEYKEKYSEAQSAIEELERILAGIAGCKDDTIVVTTHALLIHSREELIRFYDAVIVDEDFLYLQLLANSKKVSKSCLKRIANNAQNEYGLMARQMLKAEEGRYYKTNWSYPFLAEYKESGNPFDDENTVQNEYCNKEENVNDLGLAGSYVCIDDIYYYFCVTQITKMKYIVLSATLDASLYKAYFKGWNIIEYPQIYARYKGELFQFTYHSLGRADLSKKQSVYDYIKDYISPNIEIISFKKEEKIRHLNCKDVHYGNAIGINDLKGKDLVIVGTPFKNETAYRLPCCYLYGEDVANSGGMHQRRVIYKGNSFLITAYKNEYLQRFEMFSLESELEQCIGRARLLRFQCKVYLFSAFPCEQAQIISEDYLKKEEELG